MQCYSDSRADRTALAPVTDTAPAMLAADERLTRNCQLRVTVTSRSIHLRADFGTVRHVAFITSVLSVFVVYVAVHLRASSTGDSNIHRCWLVKILLVAVNYRERKCNCKVEAIPQRYQMICELR